MGERSWMVGPPADGRPTCTSCARTAGGRRPPIARQRPPRRRPRGANAPPCRPARDRPRWSGPPGPARGCAAACARPGRARPRPAPPSPWPVRGRASAACARAVSSARVRASSSAGDTGWKVASRVRLARTGSPGSSSIRSTRPATGAETTKRSRTRVSPSSSSVTSSGPGVTVAISAGTGAGRNAQTSAATTASDDDGGDEPARCEEPSDGEGRHAWAIRGSSGPATRSR